MFGNITKDTVIYEDCVLGQIKISDLINTLQSIYDDNKDFEDIIYNILKNENFDDEVISSLLTRNPISNINAIIFVLNNL